jgi:hypothetical protein
MEVQRLHRLPAVDARPAQIGHDLRIRRQSAFTNLRIERSPYPLDRARSYPKTASRFLGMCSRQISFVELGEATFREKPDRH